MFKNILERTKFLDGFEDGVERTFRERIFCILNGIYDLPLCRTCGKAHVKFVVKNGKEYYSAVCSGACSNKDPDSINARRLARRASWERSKGEILKKTKATNIEKYGCEWQTQSQVVKDKTKASNLEKFGTDCIFKSAEFKKQAAESKKAKYGDNWKSAIAAKAADALRRKTGEEKLEALLKRR